MLRHNSAPALAALLACTYVGAEPGVTAYGSMLHMGSSIQSTSRGYGSSFYNTLGPLDLETIHYANLETVSAMLMAFDKTKRDGASLSSDKTNLSRFGGSSEKIPSDGTKIYAGYDIVNFTLDYHSVKGWRESSATSSSKKSSFQSSIARIFDRFHREYPDAVCTFTSSTPVREPYWGDIKDDYDFAYNSVVRAVSKWAGEVAQQKKVPFLDLNTYCEKNGIKPGSDGRHFSSSDRDKQGTFVGRAMLAALGGTTTAAVAPRRGAVSRAGALSAVTLPVGLRQLSPASAFYLPNGIRVFPVSVRGGPSPLVGVIGTHGER